MTGGRVGRCTGIRPGPAAAAEGRQPRLAGEELRHEGGERPRRRGDRIGGPRRADERPRGRRIGRRVIAHRTSPGRVPCDAAAQVSGQAGLEIYTALTPRSASFRNNADDAETVRFSGARRRVQDRTEGDRMRRSGAPRAEPTAAMPEVTLDPRHGPLNPRKVLTSIGEVVYDWDLASDALAWGANAAEVLGVADPARLASGAGFALMVDPGGGETRHEAILRCEAADEGAGVPYRARYVLRHKGGRASTIDDAGRWYAGPDGRPARAHGVLRIDRTAPAAVDDAGASTRDRAEFLRRIRAEVAEAGRSRRPLTILVLAIDDGLEDELGFEAGEAVAAEVASRIRGVMRRRDGLVRYAGSRFALALRSCPPDQAEIAAARLRQVIAEPPLATPRGPLALALRIGGATAPDHAIDPATQIGRAHV